MIRDLGALLNSACDLFTYCYKLLHTQVLEPNTAQSKKPLAICTGLKADWTSTMKTTTQFPINAGDVVKVACSYSDAVNEGSGEVTCTAGRVFTFSEEPICSIPGFYINLLTF